MESIWLKKLILCLNFPSNKCFLEEILPKLLEKRKLLHVLTLVKCHSTIITFDLWMFEGAYDVFALL